MTGNIKKLRQLAASILVVLSLCVSSVSACACACTHHVPESGETEVPSCHAKSHREHSHGDQFSGKKGAITDTVETSCECCLQAPPKIYVKRDNLRIEKQTVVAAQAGPDLICESALIKVFSAGIYSSRISLPKTRLNLTPGRAPPRL